MSAHRNRQEIYDRYADAATELIMDQYAEAISESAISAEGSEAFPDALDEKCQKLIRSRLRKQHLHFFSKKLYRITRAAAVLVLCLLGVFAVLFTTVDAVREPVINFFTAQKDGYLEFAAQEGVYSAVIEKEISDDPLRDFLPKEFVLKRFERNSFGGIYALYKNTSGRYVSFSVHSPTSSIHVDNEGAYTEYTKVLSHEAILITKDINQLIWRDPETGIVYHFESDALTGTELIALAEVYEINQNQ